MDEKIKKYMAHLQGLVRIPTVSSVNDEHTDWSQFEKLHEYMKETWPLIFKKLELVKIGKESLLFHWKSENPGKDPILLMAHQDVVPAGHMEQWSHPPFSGDFSEGCIWGRGAEDCKSVLSAEMDAIEELLEENFRPSFDIYLSFGHNEEVQCAPERKGSVLAAKYLKEHGICPACIFDEGGNVEVTGGGKLLALIGMAEKAPNEFMLYKDGTGGHASKPGKGTVLGDVARAMASVEANPMPYRLTPLVRAHLKALAPLKEGKWKEILSHPKKHWKELTKMAKDDRILDALLHTTFAVTMAEGASQANVLPSHAEATMSVRILQGDTVESVREYLKSIMPGGVKVKVTYGENPYPAGKTEGEIFELLSDTIHELYGKDTVVAPNLMLGGTDSRNYSEVSHHIFRFTGRVKTEKWGEAHQIDEKMPVDRLDQPVIFFKTFLHNYEKR